jgi:hypothetical protein
MTAAPQPVTVIDEKVARAIHDVHKQRWAFLWALLTAMGAALVLVGVLAWQEHDQIGVQRQQLAVQQQHLAAQDRELRASCGFWEPLTPLPVTIIPPAKRPVPTNVHLIAGARVAYAGQRCGKLPPASPSLTYWAKVDGVPLP